VTRPHYSLTFAVLTLAGLAYTVLTSLVAPALRSLALDLHTTATAATWLLTAPFLSAAVATPIIGRIGDMFGKKRVLVLTLAVMALGTLVSAVASSLPVMLAGRVIQGFGGGVFPSLSRSSAMSSPASAPRPAPAYSRPCSESGPGWAS